MPDSGEQIHSLKLLQEIKIKIKVNMYIYTILDFTFNTKNTFKHQINLLGVELISIVLSGTVYYYYYYLCIFTIVNC